MMMTTKEVAELMRVSTATVLNYYKSGTLKGVRLSAKKIRFLRRDVESILQIDKMAAV